MSDEKPHTWAKGYAAGRASQQGELDYWREEAERLRAVKAECDTIHATDKAEIERLRQQIELANYCADNLRAEIERLRKP